MFIAGKRIVGVSGERARNRDDCDWKSASSLQRIMQLTARLSQIPPAILANMSALHGATSTRSAQRRS